jgi:hypothetical protein
MEATNEFFARISRNTSTSCYRGILEAEAALTKILTTGRYKKRVATRAPHVLPHLLY